MRCLLFLFLLAVVACGTEGQQGTAGQNADRNVEIKVLQFDQKGVVLGLPFEGKVKNGLHWVDRNGENYFILTYRITPMPVDDEFGEETRNVQLWGYHFTNRNKGAFEVVRKVQDGVRDCWGDLTTGFIKNALSITDLDKNGYAEVAFMYTLGCRTDVSPDDLKLLLLENGQKYAIRGTTKVDVGAGEIYGGEINIEPGFTKAPKAFLNHARNMWAKFHTEYGAAEEEE